ncbi:hypothetical protein ARMSODRAFT_884252 [Armillaria solidipes]|uniref:Uncharacterized protein n=1 Tax=Armillaria solidipes TaxID=1076256 RepID=A0A2H3BYB9_9AGAR|nr:hypothetical protein ARMSODRAFT_884252 [Armillaria solidipes]
MLGYPNTQAIIPAITIKHSKTLHIYPKTKQEVALLAALWESEAKNEKNRQCLIELQAINILNKTYCKALHEQLAFYDKNKKQAGDKGKLMGDGLPVLLTGDLFYEHVVEFEAEQRRKEWQKAERKAGKADRGKALEEWKAQVQEQQKKIDAY